MRPTLKVAPIDLVWILLILGLALAVRLDFLLASNFVLDGDEAIVGLMAKHILEGNGIPVFYYGQSYMGSPEAILASGMFSLFGVSAAALKAVPLLFSIALVGLVYFIGLELGSRFVARTSSIYLALAPSTLVIWSSKARGGFIELVFVGTLAVYLLLRWLASERPALSRTICISIILGLGWWMNNQIIYFIMPIGLFMLLKSASLRGGFGQRLVFAATHLFAGLIAFIFGGLPFWFYNLEHNFASFGMFNRATKHEALNHLVGAVSVGLPILLGGKRLWASQDLFIGASFIVLIPISLLFLYLVAARFRSLLSYLLGKVSADGSIDFFIIFVLSTLLIFSLSSFGGFVEEPRYLLPLYPSIAIIVAAALDKIKVRFQSLTGGLVVFLLSINIISCYLGGRALPGQPFVYKGQRVAVNHFELIDWLAKNNIHWVRTNYWIGYRLAFETKERVKFVLFHEPGQVRIDSYEDEGRALESTMPLVLVSAQTPLVETGLNTLHFKFKKIRLDDYDVIYNLEPTYTDLKEISDPGIQVSSSVGSLSPRLAVDNSTDTRWGTGQPQQPGQEFRVGFQTPHNLRCLRYEISKWLSDYPRSMEIDAVLADGSTKRLLSTDEYSAVRYVDDGEEPNDFCFDSANVKELLLRQQGTHPVFDWSIAELKFLQ